MYTLLASVAIPALPAILAEIPIPYFCATGLEPCNKPAVAPRLELVRHRRASLDVLSHSVQRTNFQKSHRFVMPVLLSFRYRGEIPNRLGRDGLGPDGSVQLVGCADDLTSFLMSIKGNGLSGC